MNKYVTLLLDMLKSDHNLLPPAPPLRQLLGPSFILLGLGLGSGEIILWPYLAANWGLGIVWGAALGITFQYFINMEIERYSLARGESVFIGLSRRWHHVPLWLIFSTLIGFGWPGIIASSAYLLASVFGGNSTNIAIVLLLLIGLILSIGKYIYQTVERFSQIMIFIGVPFVIIITIYLARPLDWQALVTGLAGFGQGYRWLPATIPLASFLAAFAFSGAGGNLNLAQSSYIREKGYGMGHYMTKIKGLFAGQSQTIDLDGYEFEATPANLQRFKAWWKNVNREHALVFWGTGLITILLLLLLSYSTSYGSGDNVTGIQFVIHEANVIGLKTVPWLGTVFIVAMGLMLFTTQFTVLDSTSRIMSENYAARQLHHHHRKVHLSKTYYVFLWTQILLGMLILSLGFKEPLALLTLSAVINALCMFVHIGLVNWLNYKELPNAIQPHWLRRLVVIIAFIFFGVFSTITFWDQYL